MLLFQRSLVVCNAAKNVVLKTASRNMTAYRILSNVSFLIQRTTSFPHLICGNIREGRLRASQRMGGVEENTMQRNEHLRRQRIRCNWRQQDLADQLGVTIVTIQRWERGSQHPSAYYGVKLCTLFGLGTQELGLVDMSPPPPESTAGDAARAESTLSEETALWTVPYARNPHFTGRDGLLQQLGQLFEAEKPGQPMSIHQAALTQTQAITGLGGIGKTQIAIEYAYRARVQGRYHHTLWISAGSSEAILTSFVELARLLMPSLVEQEKTNQSTIVAVLLRWLEQCTSPWLLIFDNVDDLSLIQPYLPRWGNGRILLTTRVHAVSAVASSLEVESMGVMEATHFLLRRAHRFSANSPEELDEAILLVNALGHFPLAIDQAGAYIEETGCTLLTYLQLYQRHRHVLLARRGGQARPKSRALSNGSAVPLSHCKPNTNRSLPEPSTRSAA
jgi:DNA-binding XRE family transcriptional regulator